MHPIIPTYLYQRGHIFWYRQRLPISGINSTLRVSLRTSDTLTARTLALLIANFINRQTAGLSSRFLKSLLVATESGPQVTSEPVDIESPCLETMVLSTTEEKEMMSRYEMLKNQTQLIIHHYHRMELADWQSRPRTEDEYEIWIDFLQLFKSQSTEAARLNDLRQSQRLVNDYLADTEQPVPPPEQLNQLTRMVCDRIPDIYSAMLNHQPIDLAEEQKQSTENSFSDVTKGTEPASINSANIVPLGQAIEEYLTENQAKGWKVRTINQYQHSLVVASTFFGDVAIGTLTREHGRALRGILPKLIKGKTQEDLHNAGIKDCTTNAANMQISSVTANNHMNRLREFFRWCESMGYISRNPLPDDNIPMPKVSKQAKRNPITDQEAKQIFAHPLFTEHKGIKTRKIQHASHFWLPLIAAYSGMRLGEISQLSVGNIRKLGEHWCFMVEQISEEHYLKTPNAQRAIPIHNELIRIGFIQFVDYVRGNGGERLFNNIRLLQGNYSNKPSEWFIKQFRDNLGLPLHVTPHAFRHSVKDKLSRVEANPENISRLLGHAGGQYGGLVSTEVSHLVPLINAIDYEAATAHIQPIMPDAFHYDSVSTLCDAEV